MKYLITGGGTGGHIYPAISIAEKIKKEDLSATILYVGTAMGMESELAPKAGLNYESVRVSGLPRKINAELFHALRKYFQGLHDAKKILKDFAPDIVIGTGGYVSAPIVKKAVEMKIPTLIHEQNAFPGLTNRYLGKKVDSVCICFQEARSFFGKKSRVVMTGNPIRREILNAKRETAQLKFSLNPKLKTILSFGGSNGQRSINEVIFEMLEKNAEKNDFQLIHITGKSFYEDFINRLKNGKIDIKQNVKIFPYVFEMAEVFSVADIAITGPSAGALSELSAIGIPSILIPKQYAAGNHQEKNALSFCNANAAFMIRETDLSYETLMSHIKNLLSDDTLLQTMSLNTKKLAMIDADDKIYDEIVRLL